MFKTILVPLDGSRRAETALPLAARLARNTGGTLVLVRVVNLATEYWPAVTAPYPTMAQTAVDADLADASSYLKHVASSVQMADVKIATVAQFGPTASSILAVATSYNADLIVICSHGYTGMVNWIMGSVAEKIARHASIPVLVLREGGTHLGGCLVERTRPMRVLVPLDGSVHAKAALEPAADLLYALAASGQEKVIHLTRVVKPPTDDQKDSEHLLHTASDISKARRYMEQTTQHIQEGYVASGIAERHIRVSWSVALDHDIADALIQTAENRGEAPPDGCEIIAISTHDRGGLQRWTLGSITEHVLHATQLPILVVRPMDMTSKREPFLEKVSHALR